MRIAVRSCSRITAALVCAAAWLPASADYSPLRNPGRVWVYQGVGRVQPTLGPGMGLSDRTQVKYRERLQLKVIGPATVGGASVWRIEERDSIFARVLYKPTGFSEASDIILDSLRDTVSVRVLAYRDSASHYKLASGDSLAFGHRDSSDLFFYSHTDVPGMNAPIQGLSGHVGLESRLRANGNYFPWVEGMAWYLDGVGLYWAKLGVGCGQCGCVGSRELLLESLDGRAINPGKIPPGAALAKEARIACGVRSRGVVPSHRWAAFMEGTVADLRGRRLRNTALLP